MHPCVTISITRQRRWRISLCMWGLNCQWSKRTNIQCWFTDLKSCTDITLRWHLISFHVRLIPYWIISFVIQNFSLANMNLWWSWLKVLVGIQGWFYRLAPSQWEASLQNNVVECSGDRWIQCAKGQWRGKCFHLMTSSFVLPARDCLAYS